MNVKKENKGTRQSRKVFVVHGHDYVLKVDLEIFLRDIGLKPIVLHRQPDGGLTIIEKIEKYSNVRYGFVLITPDDLGYSVEEFRKEGKDVRIEYRARQNVIFELGYLLGKLGRNRICCVYKEGVTLPTDISGLLYKEVKTSIEEIGYSLMKELKEAGYKLKF